MIRFCIILGAMKSGTTSLFNYLAQHPEIAPCNEKEPSYFTHHYDDNIDKYIDLWKNQDISGKVLMEASVNHTKHPSFPETSSNLLDFTEKNDVNIKFIYIMRNPIQRIESQYTYSYARWTKQSLQERIEHGHLINVSRYAHQLDLYFDKFERHNFLLLDFDDLKSDPEKMLKKTCEFLNISNDFQFKGLGKAHNISKGRVITRPVDKLYLKYPSLKKLASIFPKSLRQSLARILFRKKVSGNFQLTDDQKGYIHEALKDDMTRLHTTYGIDVTKWGF